MRGKSCNTFKELESVKNVSGNDAFSLVLILSKAEGTFKKN